MTRSTPLTSARPLGRSLTDLREHNLAQVLDALVAQPVSTREAIEHHTGLRASSLTKLAEELQARQLVIEMEPVQLAQRGRPTKPLALSQERWLLMGLVLDRHEVWATISFLDLELAAERRFAIDPECAPEHYLAQLAHIVSWAADYAAAGGRQVIAIELAIPGAVNHETGRVTRATMNSWHDLEVGAALRSYAATAGPGIHPEAALSADRDTNYSMLAQLHEHSDWATGPTQHPVAYFGGRYALSGGVYDHSVFRGTAGLAGEFGQLVVDPQGELCWCGRTGCLETKIGLARLHQRLFGGSVPASELSRRGPDMLADLITARDRRDKQTLEVLKEAGHWLSIGVEAITAVINPGRVILDGYLALLGEPVFASMTGRLDSLVSVPPIKMLKYELADGHASRVQEGLQIAALRAVATRPALASG
ncbi:ROK family protein [Leucobacter sp. HY1910]